MSRAGRTAAGVVLSVLGAALLVWQVQQVGLENIRDSLARVGWGFLVILALSVIRFALRSLAWNTIMGEGVPLSAVIAATISGDAIGNITPLSLIVSEPAKAMYLRADVPVARSFPALTAENFFYSVSVALSIVLGIAALLARFAVDDPQVRLAALLALALMIAVLGAALWIAWKKPAFASVGLHRLPILKLDGLITRVKELEEKAYGFSKQTHGRLGTVIACEIGFHAVSFAESYYTLWLITGVSAPVAAFVLDTFNRIINVVFRWLPGRVGVDEYGTKRLAPIVGFSPVVGVTLALVRKGRMLVWAAVGLALMARRGLSVRRLASEAPRP
jgi:hypothetical protein